MKAQEAEPGDREVGPPLRRRAAGNAAVAQRPRYSDRSDRSDREVGPPLRRRAAGNPAVAQRPRYSDRSDRSDREVGPPLCRRAVREVAPPLRRRAALLRGPLGRPSAFTLVELLVAMALTAMMMGAVSYIFFQAGTVTSSTDSKVEIHAEARYILDKMAREISGAVYRVSGITPRFKGVNHPSGGGEYDTTRHYRRDGVGFLIEDPTDGLIQVCYSLNLKDGSTDPRRASLIRFRTVSGQPLDLAFAMLTAGDIADANVDKSVATFPDWRTVSSNVVSLQVIYYLDLDADGHIHEDPPGDADGDGNSDDDKDGRLPLGNEDPDGGLGYPASFAFFWPVGAIPPNPDLPALVGILIVVRDSDDRERKVFSRYVHVPAYLDR